MDVLTESGKHSVILSKLDEKRSDVFKYAVSKKDVSGLYGIQKVDVAVASASFGSQIVIDIPRYGLLKKMVFRFDATGTGAQHNHSGAFSLFACNYFSLQTASGNELSRLYPDVLLAKYRSMGQIKNDKYAKLVSGNANGTYLEVETIADGTAQSNNYADLLFWFVKGNDVYLNTQILEPLQLVVDMKGATSAMKSATGGTLANVKLQCYFVRQEEQARKMTLKNQFPSGNPQYQIIESNYQESRGTITATTTGTFDLNVDSPVTDTFVIVRKQTEVNTEKDFVNLTAITSFAIKDSGTTIWSSTALESVNLESSLPDDVAIYHIDWRSMPFGDNLWSNDLGAVSLASLSNPQLEITLGSGTYYVYITHNTLQMAQITPNNNFKDSQISIISSK